MSSKNTTPNNETIIRAKPIKGRQRESMALISLLYGTLPWALNPKLIFTHSSSCAHLWKQNKKRFPGFYKKLFPNEQNKKSKNKTCSSQYKNTVDETDEQ